MPQKPHIPWLIWLAIVALLLMGLISNIIAARNPSARSYPRLVQGPIGPKGDTPQIDYTKIANIINQQIATLPKPKDGIDGTNGKNGVIGNPGVNGTNGQDGLPGVQGADGLSVELRYNAAKQQIEWRYVGDITWKLLVSNCTLANTCTGP